jgi:membrane-bound ClpP family serine protease
MIPNTGVPPVERAIADGSNFIWLRIESAGGAPEQSLVLANWLSGLDPTSVKTVAYVPREARGDAALVALACDELVMHPGATIGGEGSAAIAGRRVAAVLIETPANPTNRPSHCRSPARSPNSQPASTAVSSGCKAPISATSAAGKP